MKAAIKVGPRALDKMTGGRGGWIGQGSAPHRTRERKQTEEDRRRRRNKRRKTRHPSPSGGGGAAMTTPNP